MIPMTRLRPSSIPAFYGVRFYFCQHNMVRLAELVEGRAL